VLGFDIAYLVLSLASLLVSFAFMIGSASSKYVEVRSFLYHRLLFADMDVSCRNMRSPFSFGIVY
jgi:hypothetical protein